MTLEEKLEKLTDRHEALAQSLELLRDSVHEQGDNIAKQSENIREQGRNIDRLITLAETQAAHTEALFKVADSHERRRRRMEGDRN